MRKLLFMGIGFALLTGDGRAQYGVLDPAFGTGGLVSTTFNNAAQSVVPLPDGKVLLVGPLNGAVGLYRLLPDGSPDPSFGTNGLVSVNPVSNGILVTKALRAPNGDIVVVGYSLVSGADYQLALVRFDANGALVTSFGNNGVALHNEGTGSLNVQGATLQEDGSIVVCAALNGPTMCLARCLPNGALDNTFDGDGWVYFPEGGGAKDLLVDGDGRVVVTGRQYGNSLLVARFLSSGGLDLSFGTDGVVVSDLLPGSQAEYAIAVEPDPDGYIVVSGASYDAGQLFTERYDASGVLDPTFGTNGRAIASVPGAGGGDMLLQPDGKVLIVTTAGNDIGLVRLLPSGTPDPTFGTNGVTITSFNTYDEARSLALDADGRVVVCGSTQVSFIAWMAARYLSGLPMSIADQRASEPLLAIYPVPVSDRCTVVLPFTSTAAMSITLIDATGRARTLGAANSTRQGMVDLQLPRDLAPGLYMVRVQQGDRMAMGRLVRE